MSTARQPLDPRDEVAIDDLLDSGTTPILWITPNVCVQLSPVKARGLRDDIIDRGLTGWTFERVFHGPTSFDKPRRWLTITAPAQR